MRTRPNPFGFRIALGDVLLIAGGIYVLTNNRVKFLLNALLPPPPTTGTPSLPVGGPGGAVPGGVAVPNRVSFTISSTTISFIVATGGPFSFTIHAVHTGPAGNYVAGLLLTTQVSITRRLLFGDQPIQIQTIEAGFSVDDDPTLAAYSPTVTATLRSGTDLIPGLPQFKLPDWLDTHFYIRDETGHELASKNGVLTILH